MPSHMYEESKKSINFFVGCEHYCKYCIPTFQRQMKRQKRRCMKCYNYEPHPHLIRLRKAPPKTGPGEFIFFPSSSDWAFIPDWVGGEGIDYMEEYSDRLFLCQAKNPKTFGRFKFPDNAILGTTLETNRELLARVVSVAPSPANRQYNLQWYPHALKTVTVEPILDFDFEVLVPWIEAIEPWRVWVGYDSHPKENELPEPPLEKTLKLVKQLRESGLDVRTKLIREAW